MFQLRTLDKAGAYAVRVLAMFITRLEGCYTNVVAAFGKTCGYAPGIGYRHFKLRE